MSRLVQLQANSQSHVPGKPNESGQGPGRRAKRPRPLGLRKRLHKEVHLQKPGAPAGRTRRQVGKINRADLFSRCTTSPRCLAPASSLLSSSALFSYIQHLQQALHSCQMKYVGMKGMHPCILPLLLQMGSQGP